MQALFLPIVRGWARSRDFAPSKFLIPLSFVTVAGGLLSIIGTSTNLVVQVVICQHVFILPKYFTHV